jgi:hypothetical protein
MGIYPNDDDVISLSKNEWGLTIDKAGDILQEIKNTARQHRDGGQLAALFWEDGINCDFLSAQGGGWKKGKIRLNLQLEFIPDEQPETIPPSPLDDLRSELINNQ